MQRVVVFAFLGLAGLAFGGCSGGGGGGGSTSAPATSTPTAPSTPTPPPAGPAPITSADWPAHPVLEMVEGTFHTTSLLCARCHSNDPAATPMRDAAGRDVAPFDLWRASPMANAARDPIYRAQVEVEIAATPGLRDTIEAKCISCHAPAGVAAAADQGRQLKLADLSLSNDISHLALDGVSCTTCHQIQPVADVSTTFNGQLPIGTTREIFGPYANPQGSPMAIRTNFAPVEGPHVKASASCATCHTLETQAVRADGTATGGKLQEQAAYLEWRNSAYNDEVATPGRLAANCSDCHAPTDDEDGNPIATQIARNGNRDYGTPIRSPYGRHLFLGGNTLLPAMLRDNAARLNPLAPAAALTKVIELTRKQLQQRTAGLTLGAVTRAGDTLSIPVTVRNDTGHKFPTGHPIRRLWLRLVVKDAAGATVFSSGAFDTQGRIVDAAGQPLATESAGAATQPHHQTITSTNQVQVYQSLMQDENGQATFLLLRGEGYLKDNRILPLGWSPNHADAAKTAPAGVGTDADFAAGQDRVAYAVTAPAANGPYTVEATLLYQPVSARYAAELFTYTTPAVEALKSYWNKADRRPEQIATASTQTP